MRSFPGHAIRVGAAAVLLLTMGADAQLPTVEPDREWVLTGGIPTRAGLQSFDGKSAVLRLPGGQRTTVSVDTLGETDRAYLSEWKERQPVVMPDSVGVESNKVEVEVVSEDERTEKYVYRTQHFEFTSDGRLTPSLLRDVARNFEATYELVKALPWGIDPQPEEGERFQAILVRSSERYKEEGGPENSGGVYFRGRKVFVVPFQSLGIERVGKSFAKSSDYRSDTLVHELTHQMMHASLAILPQWVVEGTAEYTNILPLRLGVFRISAAKSGLREYLGFLKARGGVPEPYPVEKLFGISNKDWSETLATNPKEARRMYFTAYLLVNYFMHMDGKGDGAAFVKFLRAVERVRQEIADYENAWNTFTALPEVEKLPNNSYRWPKSLRPPEKPEILSSPEKQAEFEKSCLEILLNGRTTDRLMEDIRSAYRRVGIKL